MDGPRAPSDAFLDGGSTQGTDARTVPPEATRVDGKPSQDATPSTADASPHPFDTLLDSTQSPTTDGSSPGLDGGQSQVVDAALHDTLPSQGDTGTGVDHPIAIDARPSDVKPNSDATVAIDSPPLSSDSAGGDTAVADAPVDSSCPTICSIGNKRCGNSGIQACALVNGCPTWGPDLPCGGRQTCTGDAPTAECTCNPSPSVSCPGTGSIATGTFCDGATTLRTCLQDSDGCYYLGTTQTCAAGKPCTGEFGTAACTCPAPPAPCTAGEGTYCTSSYQMATCTLDVNSGCMITAPSTTCSGGQSCQATSSTTAECKVQPYCFPQAQALPGLSGPPSSITDPRWLGAFRAVPTGGVPAPGGIFPPAYSADPFEFRAQTESVGGVTYLHLSWRTTADPGANTTGDPDVLYAYFVTGEGTTQSPYAGNAIVINRTSTTCTSGCTLRSGALASSISYYDPSIPGWMGIASAGYGDESPNMPAWLLDGATTDKQCTNGDCDGWTISLRIPISATATPTNPGTGLKLPVDGAFKFAQDMFVYSTPAPNTWTTKYFSWPSTNQPSNPDAGSNRAISTFANVRLGSIQGCYEGAQIRSDGITINNGGALNRTGTNTIALSPTHFLNTNVPQQGLTASLKVANCGSTPSNSPSAWKEIPGCTNLSTTGFGSVASGGTFTVQCNWTLSATEQCLYAADCPAGCPGGTMPADCRNQTQCVLVELNKNPQATLPDGFFLSSMSTFKTATLQ